MAAKPRVCWTEEETTERATAAVPTVRDDATRSVLPSMLLVMQSDSNNADPFFDVGGLKFQDAMACGEKKSSIGFAALTDTCVDDDPEKRGAIFQSGNCLSGDESSRGLRGSPHYADARTDGPGDNGNNMYVLS